MIGRLLQSAASTFGQHGNARGAQQQQPGLESVTEESHTRDLLYPDRASLQQYQQQQQLDGQQLLGSARPATARDAANFDDRGLLEIGYPGDVRLIIAQDANARYHQPQVLYDSKPFRSSSSSTSDTSRSGPPDPLLGHQRGLSRGKSATSPVTPSKHRHTPSGSLFSPSGLLPMSPLSPRSPDKSRPGPVDGRSRPSPFDQAAAEQETTQGKIAREAKEDTEALLGCMFGAPGFRLEPGTKLHILPKKTTEQQNLSKSPSSNRPISSGGGFQRKRTPLVRSTSAADVSRGAPDPDGRGMPSKPSVMFTRLFTVSVPETVVDDSDDKNANEPDSPMLYKQTGDRDPLKPRAPKQKKVPMYAIAVILQLPPESPNRLRPSTSQQGLSSLASSYTESTPPTSWRGDQGVFSSFMEIRAHGPFDSALNSHLPQVLLHWNIVNRSLELMELMAKAKLIALLENVTPFTPLIPAPTPRLGGGKAQKSNKTTQQSVYVPAGCLQDDPTIKDMSDRTSQRIVGGLRTRRVVVGQGRWGAWREEARWIGRWAGSKEQNFFLFNVLTAFLGSHTEWLEALAPRWYRKRRRFLRTDSKLMKSRTVIVSQDKMASRRLIFLLASFFPGHLNHHQTLASPNQQTQNLYSESPPTFPPRDHGIRRTGTQRSSLGRASGAAATAASAAGSGHARSVSFSLAESSHTDESAVEEVTRLSRGRRDSEAKSLRSPALVIPQHGRGLESRKASMSTVTADSAQAVPHFSNLTFREPAATPAGSAAERPRPGSGGSLASLALTHSLKRSESTAGSTTGSGRWGSMVSGFWSNRRDSSTDDSDVFLPSQESPRRSKFPTTQPHEHRHSITGLQRMVEEASAVRDSPGSSSLLSGSPRRPLQLEDCLKPRHPALSETSAGARQIPRPKKPERMPLKLSFNEDEGYIDIAMDKEHSFSSSLASSFTSVRHPNPSAGFGGRVNSNDHFSPYGSITSDAGGPHSETALDVAGWLKIFQPDFVLQAVRPYDELMPDIRRTLRAEALLNVASIENDAATTAAAAGASEFDGVDDGSTTARVAGEWHDVSDTLVADTTRFEIKRVRVRHRRRAQPAQLGDQTFQSNDSKKPSLPEDRRFEIRVVTESVMDLDPTLIDAVERVLALSGTSSRATSPQRGGTTSSAPAAGGSVAPVNARNVATTARANGINGAAKDTAASTSGSASTLHGEASKDTRPVATSQPASARLSRGEDGIGPLPGAGFGMDGPTTETRRVVLGALEDVVHGVLEERAGAEGGQTRGRHRREESSLREGVRRWFTEVESFGG